MTSSSELPYPPPDLANRVSKLPSEDLAGFIEYEMLGRSMRNDLLSMLPDDYSFEGKRVMDFGCGAGRMLRHFLAEAESGYFEGVDIDERSIDWMRENLCPPLHASVCPVDPPLPVEDEQIDLIWAVSVFTHLTGNSASWLLDLHRLLKPDGLLMASYMGEMNSEAIAGEPWDESRIGMNVLRHNNPWENGGPMVLMSDWWVMEHWGRIFEIVETRPAYNQTWAMLRKKDVVLTADELTEPGDDPREWLALRHNLAQTQRELDELSRVHRRELDELSRLYTSPRKAARKGFQRLRSRTGRSQRP